MKIYAIGRKKTIQKFSKLDNLKIKTYNKVKQYFTITPEKTDYKLYCSIGGGK